MTTDEAFEYIEQARQSEAEQRAEYGMGCVSLGLDPYDWMPAYESYTTSADPEYARACAIVSAYHEAHTLVRVVRWPPAPVPCPNDIPF